MDKKEINKFMGRFPDKILTRKKLVSKKWKCSKCKVVHISNDLVTNPAPCKYCDSIFFTNR